MVKGYYFAVRAAHRFIRSHHKCFANNPHIGLIKEDRSKLLKLGLSHEEPGFFQELSLCGLWPTLTDPGNSTKTEIPVAGGDILPICSLMNNKF
jgi:hypothetical protein